MSNDEYVLLGDALKLLIKQGMSPRNAKRVLLKALRDGRIRATGTQVGPAGEHLGSHDLPPEFWDAPLNDTEDGVM
jgi:hypothetical protein